jgi:CBS domain containing-hemolysin-like protein
VTFEDILEEVVGEIYDEDDAEDAQDASQTIFGDVTSGSFFIKASAKLDEVCDALGLLLPEDVGSEYSTFGGYVCSVAGAIPVAGDEVLLPGYLCTVTEVDARRLKTVRVERVALEGAMGVSGGAIQILAVGIEGKGLGDGSSYFSDGQWVDREKKDHRSEDP